MQRDRGRNRRAGERWPASTSDGVLGPRKALLALEHEAAALAEVDVAGDVGAGEDDRADCTTPVGSQASE
jgi:hypothetical protein